MSGGHSAWAKVKAANETEANKIVPSSVRHKAMAVKIEKFSAKQINEYRGM